MNKGIENIVSTNVNIIMGVLCLSNFCFAQDTTSQRTILEGRFYLDAYYSYDFNKPKSHEKAPFLYNHNRHNEANINLALAGVTYKSERTRASLRLMTGTYTQYNLAAEPKVLQHLFEANAGIKLLSNKTIWFDIGLMPSHIGFETAISKDCWTLTRSLLAENSPYYEAGARVSYTSRNKNWYIAALLLNGWQRIRRVEGNNTPAFGTQVTYSSSDKISLNWSTFIGNDKPDSARQWRYFNNLYAVWQLNKSWGLTLGLDFGMEQKQRRSNKVNKWYSPVAILRYECNNWAIAGRSEYYMDKAGVIVPLINTQPFQMQGYSVNIDRNIGSNSLWRIEWRMFNSSSPYFTESNGVGKINHSITTSVAINFPGIKRDDF